MSLDDDIYNYIISGDFKPEDDPNTFDNLLNMLQVDSSRRDELLNAMGIWMIKMMGFDITVLTYDEVYAFFENELITLTDQAYEFITGGNFKPEEGPYWYDLLNMLNIDAVRKDQLQGAWYQWMKDLMMASFDDMQSQGDPNDPNTGGSGGDPNDPNAM